LDVLFVVVDLEMNKS